MNRVKKGFASGNHDHPIIVKYYLETNMLFYDNISISNINHEYQAYRTMLEVHNQLEGYPAWFCNVLKCGNSQLFRGFPKRLIGNIYYIAYEFLPNGTLRDFYDKLPLNFIIENVYKQNYRLFSCLLFRDLINTTYFIHIGGIFHADLKLENIMFDKDFQIRAIDFGFAKSQIGKNGDGKIYSYCGSHLYMAPEIHNCNPELHLNEHSPVISPYNGRCADIFALGVILFGLVTKRVPFEMAKTNDLAYKYFKQKKFADYWTFFESATSIFLDDNLQIIILANIYQVF